MADMELARALLRRKELEAKVKVVGNFKMSDVFENKVQRVKVSDGIDEVVAKVSKLDLRQVTAEYDFYARALREFDAAIQRANWDTVVTVPDEVVADYKPAT